MSETENWSCYAKHYDPVKIGSIDGTDTEPHDRAIVRAINSEYRPNRHVKGKPECTIFISRLNLSTTKETIQEIFSKYGRIRRFRLVKDIVTGTPKGYAFVEYETESSADAAYCQAYKMNVDGSTIFVDFECERLLKGWKPRRLGGGFGGRKESGQLRFGGRDRPFKKPIALELRERKERARKHEERGERWRKGERGEEWRDSRRRSRDREKERNRGQERRQRHKSSGYLEGHSRRKET